MAANVLNTSPDGTANSLRNASTKGSLTKAVRGASDGFLFMEPCCVSSWVRGSSCSALLALLLPQLLEQQFSRGPMFFCRVAPCTAWHHIAFRTPSPPRQRYDMIHSEFVGRKGALAVGTETLGNFVAPPL